MTDEEIVELGHYCSSLLEQPSFIVLQKQFELQTVNHFLNTEPHESKKREGIYASFSGVRDFLGNMRAIIDEAQKIIAKDQPALSEFDARPQDID